MTNLYSLPFDTIISLTQYYEQYHRTSSRQYANQECRSYVRFDKHDKHQPDVGSYKYPFEPATNTAQLSADTQPKRAKLARNPRRYRCMATSVCSTMKKSRK